MNSFAEERMLGAAFQKRGAQIEFWNEPSRLRPNGCPFTAENAFQNAFESLERQFLKLAHSNGPVDLIALSFGSHYAVLLARKYPTLLSSISMICPGLSLHTSCKNVLRVALKDFQKSDVQKAKELEECIEMIRQLGDESFLNGFTLALQDPALMTHYWHNQNSMMEWVGILTSIGAEAGFDFESFISVLKSVPSPMAYLDGKVADAPPVFVYFGEHDPIVSRDEEVQLVEQLFDHAKIMDLGQCSHFAHLEYSDHFAETVLSLLSDT